MNNETILQAWLSYCQAILGEDWTVTFAEQLGNSPRPPKSYVTLKLINGPGRFHEDDLRKDPADGNLYLVGQRNYTLSIQSYGPGHIDELENLSTSLDEPDNFYQLKDDANIAVTNRGNVLDVSTRLPNGYESHGSLDIVFNSSKNKVTGIEKIEGVEISGEVNDEVKTVIETQQTINKE